MPQRSDIYFFPWKGADFTGLRGHTANWVKFNAIYPTLGLGPGHVPQRSDFFPHGRDLSGFEPRTFRFQGFPEGRSGCERISPDPLGYGATQQNGQNLTLICDLLSRNDS